MRILLISGSLPPMECGIGDYTARLATALGSQPDTTVAVLTDGPAALDSNNFQVLPVARGWKMSDAIPVLTTARRWHPDIIHMQYPTRGYGSHKLPWLLPLLLAIVLRKPIVQTWHEYYTQVTMPMLKTSLLNLPNALLPGGVIVVRPNYTAGMSRWYRWITQHKKFQFIPNASVLPVARLTDDDRAAIRAKFAPPPSQLVAFFGFVYPAKGIEMLFEIANPAQHHLVLICDLDSTDPYHKSILDRIQNGEWLNRVNVTGFLPPAEVSRVLAAVDTVVFPFREGGGKWNTSLQAALDQGTFVLTTSREQQGYDAAENIYYARPDNVAEMRQALKAYIGKRSPRDSSRQSSGWDAIAGAHLQLYAALLG